MREWQANRVIITAKVLGIPVEKVTATDVVVTAVFHGAPTSMQAAPQMRVDGRYGPRYRRSA
jgi:hypothetical protein